MKQLKLKYQYLVSCVLQQLGSRQSSHARSHNDNMMRCVYVWQAGLHGVQQLSVVFVLQTISQVFLHADSSSVAVVQCEQQHTDRYWKQTQREKHHLTPTGNLDLKIIILLILGYLIHQVEKAYKDKVRLS